MNRRPTRTPADPHEWFSGAIHHLGKSTLLKVWNVSARTIERWSTDQRFTESVSRTPVHMILTMLDLLMEKGKSDFARSLVDKLAHAVGCHLVCSDSEPDKSDFRDELLDDIPAIAKFHISMKDWEKPNPAEVRECFRHSVDELKQSYEAWVREYTGRLGLSEKSNRYGKGIKEG